MDIPCAQFQADLDSTFSKKGKSVVENPQRKVSLVSYEKSFREKDISRLPSTILYVKTRLESVVGSA
jgi:hypothetical protein